MTTRAGSAGLITGLSLTLILFLFLSPVLNLDGKPLGTPVYIAGIGGAMIICTGGYQAARRGGSPLAGRCAALGTVAGGLAGAVVFCLWGAAFAGQSAIRQAGSINIIISLTMDLFIGLFVYGSLLGGLGGWLASFTRRGQTETFDRTEPQMAMNVSITALPASIIAAVLAAAAFPRLSYLVAGKEVLDKSTAELPLVAALIMVLVSHIAVTLVVPHETRMSEHLCGMDEVKMAAYVGIGAAPLLVFLLLLTYPAGFTNPWVLAVLLVCVFLSLINAYSLIKLVMPKRASLPPHEAGRNKTEAVLFGSIAQSIAGRLVVLCIGCGLVMIWPLYIAVISILVNLNFLMGTSAGSVSIWKLYVLQALTSLGLAAISISALVFIYMFYLNLGRWFNRRNTTRSN